MDDGYPYWKMGIIFILMIFSALVSAAHAAFEAANESQIRKRIEDSDSSSNTNKKRALQILAMLEEPSRYINLFEVLVSGTSILIGMLFTSGFYARVMNLVLDTNVFFTKHMLITEVVTVFIILLFLCFVIFCGNVLPRRIARIHADRNIFYLYGVLRVCTPIMFLFDGLTKIAFWILRIKEDKDGENVTEDEIISIVNEGYEQGVLEDSEAEMISNIIEFNEKEVMDIMTHRKKIVFIDGANTVEETMQFVMQQPFSRFPVYEETIDNIVGVLHIKDLMKYYISGQDKSALVHDICSEPYLVPDTQPIDVLWNDMRMKKIHMAIAIDEYGQTAGLVAMEDILEEIVGNISDEYDIDEKMIIKQMEGRYLVKGLASLEEIEEILGIEFGQEDFDTLNGFLISMLGHIPADDEKAVLQYMGYSFHIVDVVDKMIRYVRVTKDS